MWRLLSGHLVHLSREHFAYNIVLFTLSGAWLEYRAPAAFRWLMLLGALAGSLVFIVYLPDMTRYAGLSGLASANVVLLSLVEIQRRRDTRLLWATILALFAARTVYEIHTGKALFVSSGELAFNVVPAAHIAGAAVAVAVFVFLRRPG